MKLLIFDKEYTDDVSSRVKMKEIKDCEDWVCSLCGYTECYRESGNSVLLQTCHHWNTSQRNLMEAPSSI